MSEQTWASLKQSVAIALTQQSGTDLTTYSATFEVQFPQGMSYAENRIYREIPMLAARQTQIAAGLVTDGDREISLSSLPFVPLVVEELSLITPAGGLAGTLVPYDLVSLDFINRVWPIEADTVTPSLTWQGGRYFTQATASSLVMAPTADDAYGVSIVGLVQPDGISVSNTTTYLSTYYPELLEAACLVFLAGALTRNFGAQADEGGQAMAWEAQYQKLLGAAKYEERRRRGFEPDMPRAA